MKSGNLPVDIHDRPVDFHVQLGYLQRNLEPALENVYSRGDVSVAFIVILYFQCKNVSSILLVLSVG